ncbi:ATP-grasp fold amidoligase family protein [uncultured Fibrobacter sp.]|uniref:ATP-grasp fold amidoligase family protein n=1 Tax=uncultured Fibrobacter sp. TaxID=261512 RepID=UPI00260F7420|nr:ATP-grasp fold amidoligase family protein [uncultured Fibrobacter sp.]
MSKRQFWKIRYHVSRTIARCLPDKLYLSIKFWTRFGYWMDWKHPKTFSEKLQWMKVYDRHEEYTCLVDKAAVKDYVASKIGREYIIPTIASFNNAEEIDFDRLPLQFVLKCTHDSGGLVVCKDKKKLDFEEVRKKIRKGLKRTYVIQNREYPYAKVPRRVIAEKFLESDSDLKDYKFYCFEGRPYCVLVCGNRSSNLTFDYFDLNWNHMPIKKGHSFSKENLPKPQNFEKMVELATKLSENFHFIRVDLYNVNGTIYFGELTFFPGSGMAPFSPKEWDRTFGDLIHLPTDENDV